MCFSGGWGIGLKHTLSRGTAKTCFNEKGDSDSVISTASVDIQTTVFDLYWRRCRGLTAVKLRQTNTISSRIHIYALVVYMSVYITKKRSGLGYFGSLVCQYQNEEAPDHFWFGASKEPRLLTLPPGVAVPSAQVSLTSPFGMGRGGSSPL